MLLCVVGPHLRVVRHLTEAQYLAVSEMCADLLLHRWQRALHCRNAFIYSLTEFAVELFSGEARENPAEQPYKSTEGIADRCGLIAVVRIPHLLKACGFHCRTIHVH